MISLIQQYTHIGTNTMHWLIIRETHKNTKTHLLKYNNNKNYTYYIFLDIIIVYYKIRQDIKSFS